MRIYGAVDPYPLAPGRPDGSGAARWLRGGPLAPGSAQSRAAGFRAADPQPGGPAGGGLAGASGPLAEGGVRGRLVPDLTAF